MVGLVCDNVVSTAEEEVTVDDNNTNGGAVAAVAGEDLFQVVDVDRERRDDSLDDGCDGAGCCCC